jgi:hypothetical protein
MTETWKLGYANKSFSFALPLIGESIEDFCGHLPPHNLYVNTFIGAEEKPEYNKHVFVLYQYRDSAIYKRFEEKLKANPNFVECYDPDPFHAMFVFEVPEQFIPGFECFITGQYSKIPDFIKHKILTFHKVNTKVHPNHPIYGTLYKMEYQYKYFENKYGIEIPREQEASSMPEYSKEFYLEQYKVRKDESALVK